MKCVFCLHILGIIFQPIYAENAQYLTENFLANLQENLKDADTVDSTYEFIDKQVHNYINLIRSTRNGVKNGKERKRRDNYKTVDISKDNHDTFIVDKLTTLDVLQTSFPQDIMLFKHLHVDCEKWYAVSLQKEKSGEVLTIHKYNGSHFVSVSTEPVNSGIKLGVHTTETGTFIVAAENSPSRDKFEQKSTVYLFTTAETLERVQRFDVEYASDVSIWEDKGEIYMGISKEMSNATGRAEYETSSVVYKWMGRHFDIVQQLRTSEARKIVPFLIGNSHFLAIPNRQNNLGDSNIYSEIFKYDLNGEKFFSYQKILTNGASDLKVFCFKNGNHHEYFLAVANTFSKDVYQNIEYKTKSIIYKFVDDYFIPFQSFDLIGVTEWLPVAGVNGEFALLAACKHEGLKIFQYNGWKFVETAAQFTDDSFGKGILSMNFYQFQGQPIVVVANLYNHGQMSSVYRVDFNRQNELDNFYEGMLLWCRTALYDTKKSEEKKLSDVIENSPKVDGKEVVLTKRLTFNNLTVENLRTYEIENYKRTSRDSDDPEMETLKSAVESAVEELAQLQNRLLETTGKNSLVFKHDIFAQHLIIENYGSFDEVLTHTINDVEVKSYLDALVKVNLNGFTVRNLSLQKAVFESNVSISRINGHKVGDLLHTNRAMDLQEMVVKGDGMYEKLHVHGLFNTFNISKETVLLVDGEQFFSGDLSVERMNADNVQATFLNKLPLKTLAGLAESNVEKVDGVLESLNIKHLIVGGYVNDVDIPTLNKHALRTRGKQNITGFYHFADLKTERFNAKIANDLALPEELISTDSGDFVINHALHFQTPLNANTVFLSDKLNRIKVKGGKLDVLLTNSEEPQIVSGYKSFEHVDVAMPFYTQGKFHMENDWINPVKRIPQDVTINGDVFLQGNVDIEGRLTANDVISEDGEYSVSKLQEEGLRIDGRSILVHLKFLQPLNVENIVVDRINGENVSDWVVNGIQEAQMITGWKIFEGDLFITGNTNLWNVNGIDVSSLKENILTVEGDQTIKGDLHVQDITTESLRGEDIRFSTSDWSEIVKPTLTSNTTLKSLKAVRITCENLNITGTINGINFDEMLGDTALKNTTKIAGLKRFRNLTVDNLTSKSVSLSKIPTLIERGTVEFLYNSMFTIPESTSVEKLYFNDKLNRLTAMEFSTNWLDDGDRTISGDQFFEEVYLYGANTVHANMINGVDLSELGGETVKIDEEFLFESATFEKELISGKTITLRGHIEGLDIDTIVSASNDEIFIGDHVNFLNDVFVRGDVHADSSVNGLNFSALCQFAEPDINETPKNLIIDGNACFIKGPKVRTFNGLQMSDLLDSTWMANKETTFTGNLYLSNVTFEDVVEIMGLLGDVKVDWLKKNYFSKSLDQTVSAKLEFNDGFIVENSIFAPQAEVQTVAGINLNEFVRTAVLDDIDQVFETTLFADIVEFSDMQGSFTVNDLNLETDVMRYDVPNIVTGRTTLQSINVNALRMDRNIKVQDVDVLDWLQNGVLKTGSQKIDGRISLKRSTVFNNGISLSGLLNKNVFDPENIMLKSNSQTIAGNKTFEQTEHNPTYFDNVKLKGRFNGMDVTEIIHNQAFRNKPNIFTSLVNFNADITAKNVVFEGYYQGVNVSQLIDNMTNHIALDNYYSHFDSLHQVAKNIKKSLSDSAHYLTYYKEVQYFTNVEAVFPVQLHFSDESQLAVVKIVNRTLYMDFYKWIPEQHRFEINFDMLEIKHNFFITRIAPLDVNDQTYLYIEYKPAESIEYETRYGEILSVLNKTSVELVQSIPNNGTKDILPFKLPILQKVCIVMSYHYEYHINVYCTEENDGLQLYQKLDIPHTLTVAVMTVDDSVYIIAINKGHFEDENVVLVWKSDKITGLFNIQQRLHVPNANDVAVAEFKDGWYLAISSGEIDNTFHTGQITIKRIHRGAERFSEYQEIAVDSPIAIQFSVLPSGELVLNALCASSTNPLIVYRYEGLSKFMRKFAVSPLERCNAITTFNSGDKSYVIAKSNEKFTLIEAAMKGY